MLGSLDADDAPEAAAERRSLRSSDAELALERLLDATRRRQSTGALAISDASGCLLAGAGCFRECVELAALAAANDSVPTRLDVLERRATVQRLAIDGIEIVLCGSPAGAGAPDLHALAAGCQRILAARR